MAHTVKRLSTMRETRVQSLDREDPLEKGIGYPLEYSWASLVAQLIKNPPAMGGPEFHPWVGKIPWRRERLPTPLFWPGEFHGLYRPWGGKESDTTFTYTLVKKKTSNFCFHMLQKLDQFTVMIGRRTHLTWLHSDSTVL